MITTPTLNKFVALDVDGTLVNHDGAMSEAVQRAAERAIAAGHQLVIATGRSLNATIPVLRRIGLTEGYAVCCNGGVTLKLNPESPRGYDLLRQEVFSPRAALSALNGYLPGAKYAVETSCGRLLSTSSFQDATFGIEAESVGFEALLDLEAVRVVVHSTEISIEDFEAAVHQAGLHGVSYSVGWSSWLDIAAAGVSKATALEALRETLQIPLQGTVAVGDGFNDLEMLRWAHRSVAMGQAAPQVQDAASEVTGTVYEDGAAKVLESLV